MYVNIYAAKGWTIETTLDDKAVKGPDLRLDLHLSQTFVGNKTCEGEDPLSNRNQASL